MGDLFNLKEVFKKNNGKAKTAIVVVVVLLMIIAIGSSPEENNTNILENSGIINEENLQSNVENEKINDDITNANNEKIESNRNEETDKIPAINEQINEDNNKNNEQIENINNDKVNIEEENITEVKEENKIDLNKLKNEELAKIPAYSNSPYYVINNNSPFFYDTDLVTTSYEKYSNLDNLRKVHCYNFMYRKRFNANRRTRKYRKCKANRLAYCKI